VTARHAQALFPRHPLLLSVFSVNFGVRFGVFSITEITDFAEKSETRNGRLGLEI